MLEHKVQILINYLMSKQRLLSINIDYYLSSVNIYKLIMRLCNRLMHSYLSAVIDYNLSLKYNH